MCGDSFNYTAKWFNYTYTCIWASLVAQMVKKSFWNVGDPGSIPVLGRFPGGRHGNPLQYSCLENPLRQRSLVGYSPWGHRVGHDWTTNTFIYSFSFQWNQFSFQSQSMPKTVQTTTQSHSFHILGKVMPQILQARLEQYVNWEPRCTSWI